jgi:hypothetical protein
MVDNINLNKISPLLSSAERVKRVDRKHRDDQKPPFKSALKDEKKKKKKKKKKRETEIPAETRNTGDSSPRRAPAVKKDQKRENSLEPDKDKKIIDIRV